MAKYADAALRALAATGPLSAETRANVEWWIQSPNPGTTGRATVGLLGQLLTAYDALAAQVAQLQGQMHVEQALRCGAESAQRECADALQSALDREAPSHQRRLALAEEVRTLTADLAALRATVDERTSIARAWYNSAKQFEAYGRTLRQGQTGAPRPIPPTFATPDWLIAHPTPTREET